MRFGSKPKGFVFRKECGPKGKGFKVDCRAKGSDFRQGLGLRI